MFKHSGHRSKVADFDWNEYEKLVIGSVEENNLLQVWEMVNMLLMPVQDALLRQRRRHQVIFIFIRGMCLSIIGLPLLNLSRIHSYLLSNLFDLLFQFCIFLADSFIILLESVDVCIGRRAQVLFKVAGLVTDLLNCT